MKLTQDHRFCAVTIGGVLLAPGQYAFAQLNTAYPANFPATWLAQPGAAVTNASGSLIVGPAVSPVLTSTWNGAQLTLTWAGSGRLLQAAELAGPWIMNAAAGSPFVVTPTEPCQFFRVLAE
jgi:hypothetical protein